ncbi:unnamed protein product [Penicillium palitans]
MAINAPVSRNGLRVLMMHDCLIEVTRFDSGESAIFWLAGYLDNETRHFRSHHAELRRFRTRSDGSPRL